MFYNESLDACLSVLISEGVQVDDNVLVVRDATGRLTVCLRDDVLARRLSKALTDGLGSYAASPAAVGGALAETLLANRDARLVERNNDQHQFSFKYLDRRMVGTDWLVGPIPATANTRRRFVFASLKGGVGRTTALTVAAANLAKKGVRVLAIDLDLEAPGIGSMLLGSAGVGFDNRPKFGAIDYLLEDQVGSVDDESLIDFIGKSTFSEGFIDVIPAVGRVTDERPTEFIQKLSRAMTDGIEGGKIVPFHEKIWRMVNRFESYGDYDVIMIDSRAGIAEISAAPLMTLGAHIFFFATDQEQTFSGYRYILSYMSAQTDFDKLDKSSDWRDSITFVQSKSPASEAKRAPFRNKVFDLCSDWLYEEASSFESVFNYSSSEKGIFVPHDATYIKQDSTYEAFDPTLYGDQLDEEVYAGPFGPFISRFDQLLKAGGILK